MFQEVYYERFKYQEDKCNSSVWMIMIIITIILQFVQYSWHAKAIILKKLNKQQNILFNMHN